MGKIVVRVLQIVDYSPTRASFGPFDPNEEVKEVARITLPDFTPNSKARELAFGWTNSNHGPWYSNPSTKELEINIECREGCRSTSVGDYVVITRDGKDEKFRCESIGWKQV